VSASPSRSVFVAVQALWGSALVVAPGVMLAVLGGAGDSASARRVLRVLGARHMLQALAEQRYGTGAVRLGSYVEALHALSCIGFGCVDRRWRRAAFTDAAISTGFALVGCSACRVDDPSA
jgi:hypothetical protein